MDYMDYMDYVRPAGEETELLSFALLTTHPGHLMGGPSSQHRSPRQGWPPIHVHPAPPAQAPLARSRPPYGGW